MLEGRILTNTFMLSRDGVTSRLRRGKGRGGESLMVVGVSARWTLGDTGASGAEGMEEHVPMGEKRGEWWLSGAIKELVDQPAGDEKKVNKEQK